jgi:hypothetical protein
MLVCFNVETLQCTLFKKWEYVQELAACYVSGSHSAHDWTNLRPHRSTKIFGSGTQYRHSSPEGWDRQSGIEIVLPELFHYILHQK